MWRWKKLGLIFNPENKASWMYSHAQLPVLDHLHDDIYRIYFASRTSEQRSHVGYVDLDITKPDEILNQSQTPVIEPGNIGFFDEHGVFPSSIVTYRGKKYMYYIGWTQGYRQPLFYADIGLAISEDNGSTYKKQYRAPIMSRSEHDPCLVTSPNVFIDCDGVWKMTYVSGVRWEEIDSKLQSYYHIKYAESTDGITWNREGVVAIDFDDVNETNIARSSVIRENDMYKMWYCYVRDNKSYRIGYAESDDCKAWVRKDGMSGIDVSEAGFDSEMICYPNIIDHNGKKYMVYNGNNYGYEGIGMAVMEDM